MEQLNKLAVDLEQGVKALADAKEQIKSDTDKLLEKKLSETSVANEEKLAAIQKSLQEIRARQERVGAAGTSLSSDEQARKEAFSELIRKGNKNDVSPEKLKLLTSVTNVDGGYMIPLENGGLIQGRIFQTSDLRKVAKVIQTSNKSIDFELNDSEAQVRWDGEAPATTAETNTPNVGNIEITARKMIAYPSISQEMLADTAYDIENWLTEMLARDFARTENTSFVVGNGVTQPRGFLTYANWSAAGVYTREAVEQIPNGSTTAITETGLLDLMGALKADYHPNAVWVMKQATWSAIQKINGANNYRYINLQPANGSNAPNYQVPELHGRPVILADDMPVIANNALTVAFGDFSRGYTIVDRVGMFVQPDPFTAPGRVRYYTTKRTGGQVTNFEAIKLLRMSVS